jgi:hypothetical protein
MSAEDYRVTEEEAAQIKATLAERQQTKAAEEQMSLAAGLADTAARLRAVHREAATDPKHPFFGRPDLAAQAEANIAAMYAQAGIQMPVAKTPAQTAAERHKASFSVLPDELNSNMTEMLDKSLAQFVAAGEQAVREQTAALRTRLTPAVHDTLVAAARAQLGPKYNDAVAGHRQALIAAAGQAARNAAKFGTRTVDATQVAAAVRFAIQAR